MLTNTMEWRLFVPAPQDGITPDQLHLCYTEPLKGYVLDSSFIFLWNLMPVHFTIIFMVYFTPGAIMP